MPTLLALLLQIAQQLPLPVVVRVALPSYAFIGWRGLFTEPVETGPLAIGIAVSLALAVAASALASRLDGEPVRRRGPRCARQREPLAGPAR